MTERAQGERISALEARADNAAAAHAAIIGKLDSISVTVAKISVTQDSIAGSLALGKERMDDHQRRIEAEREERLRFETDIRTSARNARWAGAFIAALAALAASVMTMLGVHVTTPPHH